MMTSTAAYRSSAGVRPFVSVAREAVSVASLVLILSAAFFGCAQTSGPATVAPSGAATQTAAARMVELGAAHAESFLAHSQAEAIRNMLGGVRGVFLAPDMTAEAAILGIEHGTGFLLRRQGKQWSDPVFLQFSETSIGYQAGVKESHLLVLLMTETAVDNFVKGKMEFGGTGGFAIGTYGLGVSGTGEIKGGLEMIMLATNKGAFGGGGWAEAKPALATKFNDEIYGKGANTSQILSAPGGRYGPAVKVRQLLSQMVEQAWE